MNTNTTELVDEFYACPTQAGFNRLVNASRAAVRPGALAGATAGEVLLADLNSALDAEQFALMAAEFGFVLPTDPVGTAFDAIAEAESFDDLFLAVEAEGA